jgi:hypothetical protein
VGGENKQKTERRVTTDLTVCTKQHERKLHGFHSSMRLRMSTVASLLLLVSVTHLKLACEAFVTPCSPRTTADAALTAGHVKNDSSLQQYWAALPAATIDNEQLILKAGTCFLSEPSLGSSMFLRPVYSLIEEKIKEVWQCGDRFTYVIVTPGE